MLRGIVNSSLQLRFLLVFFAAALLIVGVVQLRSEPVDLLPEFSPPQVEVQTEALGLAAAEVEALITVPLEEMLSGVPWLESMRSRSITGLSSVVLTFEPGTDVMDARQMVQERLLQTSALPRVSKRPAMLQPVSSVNRVMNIGLSSDKLSLVEVSVLARWNVKPRLLGVPGVANVAVWGQRERQLQVQVDPERLRERGVRLADVITAAGDAMWSSPLSFLQASTPGNGGFIDTPNQRLDIRHVQPIASPEDLSRVTFQGADGALRRLGEVAEVVEGHPPLIGDGIVNDGPGLLLVVEKFPWANTLEVTEGVERALEALKPGLPGVEIDPTIFRPATFVETSVRNLATALAVGAVLAAAALLVLLRAWRAALICLVSVPLSLLTALLVLHLFGIAANAMVLAGLVLALGLVVDDAVADTESIARRLRENRAAGGPRSPTAVILDASLEIRRAAAYATLIVLLPASLVLLVGGPSGALLWPLALAYALALLASMAVALTVTPALGLFLLPGAAPERRDLPLVRRLREDYETVLSRILRAPRAAFAAAGAVALLGLATLPLLGYSPMPSFEERDFLMRWAAKPGTSYPEMSRVTSEITRRLRSVPGVRNVGAHLGRAVTSDEVADINTAELWVSVDPGADYEETVAAISKVAAEYPGLRPDALSFATARLGDALARSGDDLVVRVYGPDLGVLAGKAEEVRETLARVEGVVAPRIASRDREPGLEIEVDLAAAERHGIKPGDVRRAATTLLAGIEVGSLFEEQKVFEVVVWGAPEIRSDPARIGELLIDTPGGGHVRLGDVADVRPASSQGAFEREGASRWVDVSANVAGRDLGSVVGDVERRLKEIAFPLEYHPELVGEYAERRAAQARLLAFAAAAALGIFLLLQASFGSWRLASVAFLALPSALAGGVLATLAGGGVVSLGSLVGFLTVLGIAARNGILLIHHCQHLEREEGEAFGPGLVLRGAQERLRPILMTALTTGLAISPLVLLGQIPGLEIVHPMAVVILGGLVTSTLLNLFVVPALYSAPRSEPEPTGLVGSVRHAAS